MHVYCGEKVMLELEVVHPVVMRLDDPRALPSDFLAGEWGVGLLSQDGFLEMKEIVTDIYCTIGDSSPKI
jgi:hypothetical protein